MRNRGFFTPIEIGLIVLVVVGLFIGWRYYIPREFHGYGPAVKAQKAPSALYARLMIRYTKPPIYEEEYRTQDVEGVSSFEYRIRSYNCNEITIKAPAGRMYDVSFFFGKLNDDGIWQLVDRDPRPDADAFYTVYVKQLADYREGDRTVTFTNPHYWATSGGQQFQIDLSKRNASDILHMQGTKLQYETIVNDFRNFGPEQFRANVRAAQARARTSTCR
jgi:hypothetical protein